MKKQLCIHCGEPFSGRADKKFCSESCRSNYHYYQQKEKEDSLFKTIDKQLKANRRILKDFNRAGKATVRKEVLLDEGFNPKYFTHYWKAKNGNVYLFCYEYGFMKKIENIKEKYVLIQWQSYMD
jgi:predicted nucleic acid-binding Zn ribbon protein